MRRVDGRPSSTGTCGPRRTSQALLLPRRPAPKCAPAPIASKKCDTPPTAKYRGAIAPTATRCDVVTDGRDLTKSTAEFLAHEQRAFKEEQRQQVQKEPQQIRRVRPAPLHHHQNDVERTPEVPPLQSALASPIVGRRAAKKRPPVQFQLDGAVGDNLYRDKVGVVFDVSSPTRGEVIQENDSSDGEDWHRHIKTGFSMEEARLEQSLRRLDQQLKAAAAVAADRPPPNHQASVSSVETDVNNVSTDSEFGQTHVVHRNGEVECRRRPTGKGSMCAQENSSTFHTGFSMEEAKLMASLKNINVKLKGRYD
eukprot:PhM_4_TR3210/c0_g1_i1/m.102188